MASLHDPDRYTKSRRGKGKGKEKKKKKRKGEKGEGGEDGDGITRRRDNISKNKFLKEGIEEHKCRVNCGIKADIITNKAKNIE